jgi:hypothetical protein
MGRAAMAASAALDFSHTLTAPLMGRNNASGAAGLQQGVPSTHPSLNAVRLCMLLSSSVNVFCCCAVFLRTDTTAIQLARSKSLPTTKTRP